VGQGVCGDVARCSVCFGHQAGAFLLHVQYVSLSEPQATGAQRCCLLRATPLGVRRCADMQCFKPCEVALGTLRHSRSPVVAVRWPLADDWVSPQVRCTAHQPCIQHSCGKACRRDGHGAVAASRQCCSEQPAGLLLVQVVAHCWCNLHMQHIAASTPVPTHTAVVPVVVFACLIL
jgi:hypothetical protein